MYILFRFSSSHGMVVPSSDAGVFENPSVCIQLGFWVCSACRCRHFHYCHDGHLFFNMFYVHLVLSMLLSCYVFEYPNVFLLRLFVFLVFHVVRTCWGSWFISLSCMFVRLMQLRAVSISSFRIVFFPFCCASLFVGCWVFALFRQAWNIGHIWLRRIHFRTVYIFLLSLCDMRRFRALVVRGAFFARVYYRFRCFSELARR